MADAVMLPMKLLGEDAVSAANDERITLSAGARRRRFSVRRSRWARTVREALRSRMPKPTSPCVAAATNRRNRLSRQIDLSVLIFTRDSPARYRVETGDVAAYGALGVPAVIAKA